MFSGFHSGSFGSHGSSSWNNDRWFSSPDEIQEKEQRYARLNPLGANKVQQARLKTQRLRKNFNAAPTAEKKNAYSKAYNNERKIFSQHYFNARNIEQKEAAAAAAAAEKARRNAPAAGQKAYIEQQKLQEAAKYRQEAASYVDELGLSTVNKEELKSKIIKLLKERDEAIRTKKDNSGSNNNAESIKEWYAESITEMLKQSKASGGSRKRSARSKRNTQHKRKTHRRKAHRSKTHRR